MIRDVNVKAWTNSSLFEQMDKVATSTISGIYEYTTGEKVGPDFSKIKGQQKIDLNAERSLRKQSKIYQDKQYENLLSQ